MIISLSANDTVDYWFKGSAEDLRDTLGAVIADNANFELIVSQAIDVAIDIINNEIESTEAVQALAKETGTRLED